MTLNNFLIVKVPNALCSTRQSPIFRRGWARLPQILLSISLPLLSILPARAIESHIKQAPQAKQLTETIEATETGKTDKVVEVGIVGDKVPDALNNKSGNVESPIQHSGIPYKSSNRRDPFLAPPKPKPNVIIDEEISRGVPPPGIAGTYLAQTFLEGISIRNDRRTAIVRGRDDRAYFLHEGDRLFDGYLKTIQEDSITLVRETIMRSGKKLTQEVTKRLRTP